MIRAKLLLICVLSASMAACSPDPGTPAEAEDETISLVFDDAAERTIFNQVAIPLTTPLSSGLVRVYLYMDGAIDLVETRRFNNADPSLVVGYNAPISVPNSAILIHVVSAGLSAGVPQEYVCFAAIDHSTTRHNIPVSCDLASTVFYYLAATRIGRSDSHPFHDIESRLPLWQALVEAPDNDVNAFYASVFGTLQNALTRIGAQRFDVSRHSIRPVMETIVAQFVDHFQRHGSINSAQLIEIANRVTDHSLPLERLIRYETIFQEYAHVQNVDIDNTGGSLTERSQQVELLTMGSEVSRFYVRNAAYEMSDYRTHIVQNVRHHVVGDILEVEWEPLGHMYGYNTYLNDQHIGYTRVPRLRLPADTRGTITIRAVGYAGEFDGVHHELAPPSLLAAGVTNAAD